MQSGSVFEKQRVDIPVLKHVKTTPGKLPISVVSNGISNATPLGPAKRLGLTPAFAMDSAKYPLAQEVELTK